MKLLISKISPKIGQDGNIITSKYNQTLYDIEDADGNKYSGWGVASWLKEGQENEVDIEENKYGKTIKKIRTELPGIHTTELPATTSTEPASTKSEPDWHAISTGKVRHGVAIAFISQGVELNKATKAEMDLWVGYIMSGELPDVSKA